MVYTEQPRAEVPVELLAAGAVGQTFVAEYDGLCRVELYIHARRNTGPLVFRLRSFAESTENILTITLDAEEPNEPIYQVFKFDPLPGSGGRSLFFSLEAPHATPDGVAMVWGTAEDAYPDGEVVVQGVDRPEIRDLTFRLGYQPSLTEKTNILLDRLAANKPSLWGDRKLYVGLGIMYLILLYAVLVQMLRVNRCG
ncbi:MAG: hypothetical protein ACPLYD_12915 [Anaerolineae bacterium]